MWTVPVKSIDAVNVTPVCNCVLPSAEIVDIDIYKQVNECSIGGEYLIVE